jgi:hypothetical protein
MVLLGFYEPIGSILGACGMSLKECIEIKELA